MVGNRSGPLVSRPDFAVVPGANDLLPDERTQMLIEHALQIGVPMRVGTKDFYRPAYVILGAHDPSSGCRASRARLCSHEASISIMLPNIMSITCRVK